MDRLGRSNGAAIDDPDAGAAVEAALSRASARHEKTISTFALAVIGAGVISTLGRIHEGSGGGSILVLELLMMAYYGSSLRRMRARPLPQWEIWLRATLEVTSGFLVGWLNMTRFPLLAMAGGAPFIVVLAVFLGAMRLDPRLCVYTLALGILQHLVLYLPLRQRMPDEILMRPWAESFRLMLLLAVGFFAVELCRTLRAEVGRAASEARDRERVRSAFGSYVDRRVVDRLLKGDLKVAPERRTVTVMFVDIRDFTRFSESKEPGEVFQLLDRALDAFATVVRAQGGIVNKFLGDGLMAIFGAPESQPDHPRRAVRAALQIEAEAERLDREGVFPSLRIGIGIHTGPVVVGDLGGERREYTAIGDVVNVASRVESANKELGTTLLVTGDVVQRLGSDATVASRTSITLRGRTGPIEVFEVEDLELTGAGSGAPEPTR